MPMDRMIACHYQRDEQSPLKSQMRTRRKDLVALPIKVVGAAEPRLHQCFLRGSPDLFWPRQHRSDSASMTSIGSTARERRDAGRCRRARRIGRHHARIGKTHRHAFAACCGIRCRHDCEVRVDAGAGKLPNCGLNPAKWSTVRYFGG
jgi:hypothetical protein